MTVIAELEWGVGTHPGNVRQSNQDATLSGPRVFAVADGMGGHACGEVASATAISALAEAVDTDELTARHVLDGVLVANQAVLTTAGTRSECEGMATTLAGIAFLPGQDQPEALVFNLGDSRVYRTSARITSQVSVDHSVVEDLLREGAIEPGAAPDHPSRHVVTRALGLGPTVEPDHWSLGVERGDRFLICSDGLVNELEGQELEDALGSDRRPQAIVDGLLDLVLARTARDNVSIVLAEVLALAASAADTSDDTQPRPVRAPARDGAIADD